MMLRWAGLIAFAVVLGVVFVNLGQWQLRRLDERKAHNEMVRAAEAAPVADWPTWFEAPVGDEAEYHQVRVRGTYDPDHQFVVRNRNDGDLRGYEIVTPLRVADGRTLLVNRGLLPIAAGQQIPDVAPPPPTGVVEVIGQVRADEQGGPGAEVPDAGRVRVINTTRMAETLPYPIVNGWLAMQEQQPAAEGEFRPVKPEELTEGPHLSYAIQWFIFTAIGVIGTIVFIRADLRDRRKARAQASPDR
ncbi:SURF1 family protein [Propionibacteriaceae bacterium Y1685]